METLKGLKRTHMCGEVTAADAGKEVVLMGWTARNRLLGGLLFLTLRDKTGKIQISLNDETDRAVFEKAEE